MYRDPRFSGLFQTLGGPAAKPPTLLQKVVGAVVMAGVFMLALTFSVAFFAVLLTAGVAIWGWVWWKTRALRKAMRAQMDALAAARGARAHDSACARAQHSPALASDIAEVGCGAGGVATGRGVTTAYGRPGLPCAPRPRPPPRGSPRPR